MRISTGVEGLDRVLKGGLIPARTYLVHGETGTGKTTLGVQFVAAGGPSLLITLGETEQSLRSDAQSIGVNLTGVTVLDLTPTPDIFSKIQLYDIFSSAEVEREPVTREISKAIHDAAPQRIFVDGFGNFRHLAADAFQYRRLIQSFFRFVTDRGATLLIASDERESEPDTDGVIHLEMGQGRILQVTKFRGSDFQPGRHPITVSGHGLQVLPTAA
jgi:circadian clock protein KaiC